jgi:muconolactone delta-isomerase
MLFEVRSVADPTGITGEHYAERVLSEEVPYLKKLKADGVISHAWMRIGQDGWLAIFDVASHEQLLGVIYSNPLSPHSAYEVAPVFAGKDFEPFDVADAVQEA